MRLTMLACGLAALSLSALLGLGSQPTAAAPVVLKVDVSDLSAVRIEATGANSLINNSGIPILAGITLEGPFTSISGTGNTFEFDGDLKPSTSNSLYTGFLTFGSPDNDLSISGNSFETQDFSTDAAAFSGRGTADLSSLSPIFQDIGSRGNVVTGFSPSDFEVIGHYEVVPLPASALLLVPGMAALAAARRLRRRERSEGAAGS